MDELNWGEKIGHLIASVEALREDQAHMAIKLDALEKLVAQKLNTVETVFRILKFGGLALIAILTFKFGDVASLWRSFFS